MAEETAALNHVCSLVSIPPQQQQLKRKFSMDRNVGRLILRAEDSSNTYTTEFIAKLLDEEGMAAGLFDARSINLGVRRRPSALVAWVGGAWV